MANRLARIRSKADNALDGRYSETDSSEDEAMRAVPTGCLGKAGRAMLQQARAGEDETQREAVEGASVVDQRRAARTSF